MPVSIRARLLLLVLSVLVPAVAAALWIIARTYNAEQQALERNLRDTTRALSTVVDRELAQRAAIARVLAHSRFLSQAPDIPALQLQQFELEAREAMNGLSGWVELRSRDQQLLDTRLPPSVTLMPRPVAGELLDKPTVGPLEPSASGAVLRAALIQPVPKDGRTVLNLAVTILPDELQQIIDAQQLPPDWVASVLDHRGTIVARYPGGSAHAGQPAAPDLRQRLGGRREALFESDAEDGGPVLGYFSTSPQGWTFITALPRAQLVHGVPNAVLQIVVGIVAVLGLAVLAAQWVSQRIVEPVYSLKRAAARMQSGLPVDPRPTGIVECDDVARALAQAGAAMRDARAELERQVAEAVARTREAEQRVSHSQRVEALGRLTGGVAHDFNNLLGVISNSAHLIQRQAPGPELQVPLAATLRAVEVGSRLTQHLLRFARRQPVRPQALSLGSYLPEAQELMQTVLGQRIRIAVSVTPGTRPVTVDSSELELALINLALNARDAMPSGGHVWLKARNADNEDVLRLAPGNYVLIAVGDDGTGMDDSLAERVFEPFFTTKAVGKGTGLGLSQVHGFCAQAGGAARLSSTPGIGTTVSMILPASELPVRGAPVPAAEREGMAGANVLLVEDNEELGDVTAALLESYHCKVQRARDADDALGVLAGPGRAAVDVVLSDIVMPGRMDGVDLARTLRERWPELPVVLISGYSTALASARDFIVLQKPCTPQELLAVLQKAVEGSLRPR